MRFARWTLFALCIALAAFTGAAGPADLVAPEPPGRESDGGAARPTTVLAADRAAAVQSRIAAYMAKEHPGIEYGVYFKDLSTQETWGLGDRQPIEAASTTKLPAVLALNELVARRQLKWDDRVAYNPATDYEGGAGILQFAAKPGDQYSLRTLANLAITISDNVAYRMIVRQVGKDVIAARMHNLGGGTVFPDGRNITTAHDMGLYVEAALNFARRNPAAGSRLIDDMAHPIYHVGLPGQLPAELTVAHKEGDVWTDRGGVANDVGVVLSERPYVLAVLTRGWDDPEAGFKAIAQVSRIVYESRQQSAP